MTDVPATMTAIEIGPAVGGQAPPEVLRAATRPVPVIAPDEVLIRVAAAGVNRPDVAQRKGLYPPPPGVTDIPGLEVAGTIVRQGAAVADPVAGSEVCALVAGGGYAQYVTAPAVQCMPIPPGWSLEEAAALPETFLTVFYNVFERSRLRAKETLLVHGGTSGIGSTAIRLAKAFGARVVVTAGSAAKCAASLELGADRAINYREEDFVAATRDFTGGNGADVILDMVGGDYITRDMACAAMDGRIAVIGLQAGELSARIDLRPLMMRRLTIGGSTLRAQSVAAKGRLVAALRREVWPLFASHDLRLPIHARFPLVQAAAAHALMESSAHIGKILLIP
jgi:putative PIG3 family NAD(P)H quinone oxidoreductase